MKTVVAIDISGGISEDHIERFRSKLSTLEFDEVVGFDTQIRKVTNDLKFQGGFGGTLYSCVDAYCADATKIILFTDGWVGDFVKRPGIEYQVFVTQQDSILGKDPISEFI